MSAIAPTKIEHLLIWGDLSDGSDTSSSFREFICRKEWTLDNYRMWVEECIEKSKKKETNYSNAFQDLVVVLGKRLGLEIEFGRYKGSFSEQQIGYDGLWKTPEPYYVVVEVKTSDVFSHNVEQVGGYMKAVADREGVDLNDVFGLYVIGSIKDPQPLANQIRGSEFRNSIRIVTVECLFNLLELKDKLTSKAEVETVSRNIQNIIMPLDPVLIDRSVKIIQDLAELMMSEPQPLLPPPKEAVQPEKAKKSLGYVKKPKEIKGKRWKFRELIASGVVEEGTEIFAKYKGERYTAKVTSEGVVYEGKIYESPSAAGTAVMEGLACNGWSFWKHEKGGVTHPIHEWRMELSAKE